MYIIECIIKYIKGKNYKKIHSDNKSSDLIENQEECNHFFMPLDFSNEYFACKYCGKVLSKDELKSHKQLF